MERGQQCDPVSNLLLSVLLSDETDKNTCSFFNLLIFLNLQQLKPNEPPLSLLRSRDVRLLVGVWVRWCPDKSRPPPSLLCGLAERPRWWAEDCGIASFLPCLHW